MRKNTTNRSRAGRAIRKNQHTQMSDINQRLHELAKKYDISGQVIATGDVLGALLKALDEAKAELEAIQKPIVGDMRAIEASDTLAATVTVGGVQAVAGVGSLSITGHRASVKVGAARPKNLTELYAGLPELHKRFLELVASGAMGFLIAKVSTQQSITIVNNNQYIQSSTSQSTSAQRQQIMLRVSGLNFSLLRDAPSLDSDVIVSMKTGDIVLWEQDEGEWTKIVYFESGRKFIGWVLAAELKDYVPPGS